MSFKTVSVRILLIVAGIAAVALASSLSYQGKAQAQESRPMRSSQFNEFKGDGYYWYRQDPPPEPPKKVEPPKPAQVAPAPAQPKALSHEWLRENLPKLLDIASNDPTPENVANYMYAQRVVLDKANNFSNQVKLTIASDPFLDENNRVPITQFGINAFKLQSDEYTEEALTFLSGKAGIWVFTDNKQKCSACADYVRNILVGRQERSGVATKYGFNFREINVGTPEGKLAAKRLGLKVTPTTVMVHPPNNFSIVSQGLMAQPMLKNRLLLAARTHKLLPEEIEKKADPFNQGLLTTEQMRMDMPDNGRDPTPTEVMNELRQRIHGPRYQHEDEAGSDVSANSPATLPASSLATTSSPAPQGTAR